MNNEEIEALKSEIEKLKKEVEENKNNWKRALADYQNLEKRKQQEQKELYGYLTTKIFRKVIPILDLLETAQGHLKDSGLELVLKQFKDILEQEGIKKIEAVGIKFDPATMECVEVVQGQKKDQVVGELRAGYLFGNELLRAALVKVGGEEEKENI